MHAASWLHHTTVLSPVDVTGVAGHLHNGGSRIKLPLTHINLATEGC